MVPATTRRTTVLDTGYAHHTDLDDPCRRDLQLSPDGIIACEAIPHGYGDLTIVDDEGPRKVKGAGRITSGGEQSVGYMITERVDVEVQADG